MGPLEKLASVRWIANVFYPLAIILMEVLWLNPWLTWAGLMPDPDWEKAPLSLLSLLAIIVTAFTLARRFPRTRESFLRLQLALILLVIFLVIRLEYGAGYPLFDLTWFAYAGRGIIQNPGPLVLALLAAAFIAWRGISLGRSLLYFKDVARYFIFGLAALVLLIIVWRASMGVGSLENLASAVGLQVTGFFFFGLLSLALGNLQDVQRRMQPGDRPAGSLRRLVPIQLVVVASIILLGMGIVSIFSSEFVDFLGALLSRGWNLFSQAMVYILMPFDFLARVMALIIDWLVNLLRGGQAPQPFQLPDFFIPGNEAPPPGTTAFPEVIVIVLKWLFFAAVAFFVLAVLMRALRRARALRADEEIEEIQESLWSWDGLLADLRLLFDMLLGRFRKSKSAPVPAFALPEWHLSEETEDGLDVREIYRRLLWEASDYGLPRRYHETPGEYARRLAEALPGAGEQVEELTGIYLDRRYGERAVGEPRETRANGIWRFLHRLLRRPESGTA